MVILDSTVLLLLLDPNARPPIDQNTGKPLARCLERVACLLESFENTKTIALIPAPVLCEVLVFAKNRNEVLKRIHASPVFDVGAFDRGAAIATAELIKAQLPQKDINYGKSRMKFDAQILGIAKVRNATAIYTDDQRLAHQAIANNLTAISTHQLPLPPQGELPLD